MRMLTSLIPAYVLLVLSEQTLLAQWVQTNGPNAGNVLCLAGSGANLFVGTDSCGVFLSTNSGVSWTTVNTGLTSLYILSLAIADTNFFAATGGGFFRSTNAGASWTAVTAPAAITALATGDATLLFAGSEVGVLYFYNIQTGEWVVQSTFFTGQWINALAFRGSTILFAAPLSRLYRSTNYGASWTHADTGLTNIIVSALAPTGTNLFVGTLGIGRASCRERVYVLV